jgi:hypothetical protein
VAFRLPRSKSAPQGEDLIIAPQLDASGAPLPYCPERAYANHVRVNDPHATNEALFTYTKKRTGLRTPLTKRAFLTRIKAAAEAAGCPMMAGHAFRIGGTLHYLLRGVPFDVVKVIGRWASDAWQKYLREHAEILSPYLQNREDSMVEFTSRIAMPTVIR